MRFHFWTTDWDLRRWEWAREGENLLPGPDQEDTPNLSRIASADREESAEIGPKVPNLGVNLALRWKIDPI